MYKSNFYAKMLPKECTFKKYEPCLYTLHFSTFGYFVQCGADDI